MLCTLAAAHGSPALLPRLQTDPLRETLDKVLPKENRELITEVPVSIPQGVKDICNELESEDGIEYVVLGRQAEERRVVSQVRMRVCLGFCVLGRQFAERALVSQKSFCEILWRPCGAGQADK